MTYLAPRMVVEVPFVVFAVLVPFIATGPRTEVLGVSVSEPGLLAGIALLVKGTLGVLASLTLAATTEPQDLLRGLQRLRMPDLIVQIMGFMIRYLDVVTAELGRMMTAHALARLRPALAHGTGRRWPGRWARCSSAPTSAASACTSRCCRAGTTAKLQAA